MDITFVDGDDNVIGYGSKQEAIQGRIAHRVSNVILMRDDGDVLLQRRHDSLPSYPGRWDTAAAGHVDRGETYEEAAIRELREEIGVVGVILTKVAYYFREDEALRFNTVFKVVFNGDVSADPDEVSATRWFRVSDLIAEINRHPDTFTPGCRHIYTNLGLFE